MRGFRRDDLDALAATLNRRDVVRHLGGHLFDREDSWRRLTMAVGQWPLLGYGYWAVVSRMTGLLVGQVGFADFERDLKPSNRGEPEMGWIFDPSVHGQGMAREACRAALGWLGGAVGATDVSAVIAIENARSMRLAERLGFVREPDALYRDEPIALFRRTCG